MVLLSFVFSWQTFVAARYLHAISQSPPSGTSNFSGHGKSIVNSASEKSTYIGAGVVIPFITPAATRTRPLLAGYLTTGIPLPLVHVCMHNLPTVPNKPHSLS